MTNFSQPRRRALSPLLLLAACCASTPALAQSSAAQPVGTPSSDEVFNAWDADKNRVLSPAEFKAGWSGVRETSLMSRVGGQFCAVDTNKDGVLQPVEYSNLPLMKRAGGQAPPMSTFDKDNNGKLDFREYVRMVETMVRESGSRPGG